MNKNGKEEEWEWDVYIKKEEKQKMVEEDDGREKEMKKIRLLITSVVLAP